MEVASALPTEYQYHLKDHLGNVRTTFTTKDEIEAPKATLETATATTERGQFLNYDNARKIYSHIFDRTNGTAPTVTPGYSQRLSGSATEKIGLARSLSVMPGDKLQLEVFAKYFDASNPTNISAFASWINTIALGTATGGTIIDGAGYATNTATNVPFGGLLNKTSETGTAPKAYLNWLVFDRNYTVDLSKSGYKRLTTAALENGNDAAFELIKPDQDIIIAQAGYAYIWISNENLTPVEVYFDDFKVTHIKSPVVQSDDYYPFGLTFNSYSRENSVPNKIKFQGQEHIDDLGLNWDSFKWRNHQPDIGRFFNVDPLAEKYSHWSPYAFSGNQVVNARELEGLEPYVVTGRSFIPDKTAPNPYSSVSRTKSFKGDNRSFDPKATSYRSEQKVRVDFDNKKVSTLNNTASKSEGLDSKGNVIETSQPGKAGPTPTYDKGAMEKGNSTTINMQVDASNSLVPAPAINYDVSITISQQEDGSVNYNMTGATDGFPAYEFYVTDEATGNSTMIYGSDPNKTGDGPGSLIPPMEKTIKTSGNANGKKKPDEKE